MNKKNQLHKCLAKDCKRKIEKKYLFCSIECACYSKKFNVRKNIKTNIKEDK